MSLGWAFDLLNEAEDLEQEGLDLKDFEPQNEPCRHCHEVGVVQGELQNIYLLAGQYRTRSKESAAELLKLSGSDRQEKLQETGEYDTKADLLMEIFWVSCREEFPELWTKSAIGLFKGWKLMWSEHPIGPPPILAAVLAGSDLSSLRDAIAQAVEDADPNMPGDRSRMH